MRIEYRDFHAVTLPSPGAAVAPNLPRGVGIPAMPKAHRPVCCCCEYPPLAFGTCPAAAADGWLTTGFAFGFTFDTSPPFAPPVDDVPAAFAVDVEDTPAGPIVADDIPGAFGVLDCGRPGAFAGPAVVPGAFGVVLLTGLPAAPGAGVVGNPGGAELLVDGIPGAEGVVAAPFTCAMT